MNAKDLTALKLRMHRLNAGLSPEELASRIAEQSGAGVSGQTIRRLERGTKPNPSTAKQVADYFGTTVTDLWPQLLEDVEAA